MKYDDKQALRTTGLHDPPTNLQTVTVLQSLPSDLIETFRALKFCEFHKCRRPVGGQIFTLSFN